MATGRAHVQARTAVVRVSAHARESAKPRHFVASTRGRQQLLYLSPYSPELNPDEWVWHNITHDHVAKMAARGLEKMKARIERVVGRLQSCREIALRFFRSPDLAYINI